MVIHTFYITFSVFGGGFSDDFGNSFDYSVILSFYQIVSELCSMCTCNLAQSVMDQ
jgi:hypothetical protein